MFPVLHALHLGHRVSFLPAVNLCQISELSLVLLALGKMTGDVSDKSMSVVAFAFAFLAVDTTYVVAKSGLILRKVSPWLTKLGFADLPAVVPDTAASEKS